MVSYYDPWYSLHVYFFLDRSERSVNKHLRHLYLCDLIVRSVLCCTGPSFSFSNQNPFYLRLRKLNLTNCTFWECLLDFILDSELPCHKTSVLFSGFNWYWKISTMYNPPSTFVSLLFYVWMSCSMNYWDTNSIKIPWVTSISSVVQWYNLSHLFYSSF